MGAWYNEIDPQKAAWLRELIAKGLIAPGDVDERSIADVRPDDLAGYTQCHFFAGVGAWSYALRCAGWPDSRSVWTGSCPCQPFSAAGKRKAKDDPRHLWPDWFRLIEARRPVVLFSEQVSSIDGLAWLDLVQSDLDGAGYTCGTLDICAASIGAPHIRQRLYFVANAGHRNESDGFQLGESTGRVQGEAREQRLRADVGDGEHSGGMANASDARRDHQREHGSGPSPFPARPVECGDALQLADTKHPERGTEHQKHPDTHGRNGLGRSGALGELGDSCGTGLARRSRQCQNDGAEQQATERASGTVGQLAQGDRRPGPVNGRWANADWLRCRDGKWRPTESRDEPMAPGIAADLGYLWIGGRWTLSPLVHGAKGRVPRLRGYGDAIVAPLAQAFIEAYISLGK